MKEFRAQHGNFVVGEVTIDMVSLAKKCVCESESGYVESWPVYVNGCPGLPCYAITVAFVFMLCGACVMRTCIACARLRGYVIGTRCRVQSFHDNMP